MKTTLLLGVILSLSACDFMYDEADDGNSDTTSSSFTNIDATEYGCWTYISLHYQTATIVAMTDTDKIPTDWDFAIHRYDVKTNNGAVWQTSYSSLSDLSANDVLPSSGTYEEDVWTTDVVISDASGMINNNLKYAETYRNAEFSKWMSLDLSIMPPFYTTSNLVYILRMKDGTYAAVRFTDYMNGSGTKGYISFNYIYPFE